MDLQGLVKQAIGLHQQGNLPEAERLYLRILAADHSAFAPRQLLGVLRAQQGRNEEALELIEAALKQQPGDPVALSNYGNVLRALGRPSDAVAAYDRVLAAAPRDAVVLYNRGVALAEMKRPAEALASFDRVLAVMPRHAEALHERGGALRVLGRFEEAVASYDRSLAIRPGHLPTLNSRGNALHKLKHFEAALASYRAMAAAKPDDAGAHFNCGIVLMDLERFGDALLGFDRALAIRPGWLEARYNRAQALLHLKQLGEAAAGFRGVAADTPDHRYALGGALEAALQACDWEAVAQLKGAVEAGITAGKLVMHPFTFLGLIGDPGLQRACALNYLEDALPERPPPWRGAPYRREKIRVAYLSADFQAHATAFLIAELIERHDRARFEVIGFSWGDDDGGDMRARLRRGFDSFHDVSRESDAATARRLRELEVDIAIDLKGYTGNARPGILAERPCPVQAQYLGYPGTMAAGFIDYVIGDAVVTPFEQSVMFSEKIVQLPDCYQVNDTRRAIAAAAPTRAGAGLPEKAFVFCCFNNSWKISAPLFSVWMRLLAAVPGSVLWLLADNEEATANLRAAAAGRGIDAVRLVFAPRMELDRHLARHRLADLFLDTLPYNAHTTGSDALWAGLPMVTCRGESFSGRVGASLLTAAGLPELVTENLEDYGALARRLAEDNELLGRYRQRLARTRDTCALFDIERFRRSIEAAYTTMWDIARRGEAPRSLCSAGWTVL